MTIQNTVTHPDNSIWGPMYRVGAVAAIIMAVFIPLQIIIYILKPPPDSVEGWYALFRENSLIGLLDMDLLLIVDQILLGLIILALYLAVRRRQPSLMTLGLVLTLVGTAAYFASTGAFEMLSLSNQYRSATAADQQTVLLAAGHMVMANWQGTAFDVGYVLAGIALLLIAIAMLRSSIFGKAVAIVGLLLGILSLLPPTAGLAGMIFSLASLLPLEIWIILIARKLFQVTRLASVTPNYQ